MQQTPSPKIRIMNTPGLAHPTHGSFPVCAFIVQHRFLRGKWFPVRFRSKETALHNQSLESIRRFNHLMAPIQEHADLLRLMQRIGDQTMAVREIKPILDVQDSLRRSLTTIR